MRTRSPALLLSAAPLPWLDSGPKAFTWPVADPVAAHRRRASNPEDGPGDGPSLIDTTLGPVIVYTNLARHRQCGGLFLKALNKPVHALSWHIQDPASLVPLLTARLQHVVNKGWSGKEAGGGVLVRGVRRSLWRHAWG